MNTEAFDDQARWYAVRTKPREESRADLNLRNWEVQTFAPMLRELRTSGYGSQYVNKSLFANYIFAHFNVNRQLSKIRYTRGVRNVVSFGGNPISIDDNVIELIKARVDEDGFIRRDLELKVGDRIKINSGPFESLVGIFKRSTRDKDRVQILLDVMKYQGHLVVNREMVEKVS
ncbi:MAG: transcriptional antiterminator RfaH [Blastocatellia bacterium]|jgi:transcriptional antiterminator RfaH|nr:transcriptional antiterminator RfaH [Blastocatellia bacterium]